MRSLIPILLALLVISACKSTSKLGNGTAADHANIKPKGRVIEGFDSPESILITRNGMFVSNVGPELLPQEEDGDGYISKLTLDGEIENEQFIGELNAPKGMAERGGILYVADINVIHAFKTENGEPVNTFDLREYGASFLNDIVFQSSDVLLITDTDLNVIFSLNVKTNEVKKNAVPDDFAGPNGLYFDETTEILVIVGFGTNGEPNGKVAMIFSNDMNDGGLGQFVLLDTPMGSFDGVAFIGGKYIVWSDWGEGEGRLRYYNTESKETWLINLDNTIAGPADFAFDAAKKCLWIPAMQEGKIYQEYLDFY